MAGADDSDPEGAAAGTGVGVGVILAGAEVISGVIDGVVTENDLDSEDYPCRETMKRWKFWFHKNVPNIEGMIRRVCGKLFPQAALLSSIREMSVNWLETVARIICNSGGKLFSTGWAYAPDL